MDYQLIFLTPLMELNLSGIASLFSIINQYLIFPLYNKIILKSQYIFRFLFWRETQS